MTKRSSETTSPDAKKASPKKVRPARREGKERRRSVGLGRALARTAAFTGGTVLVLSGGLGFLLLTTPGIQAAAYWAQRALPELEIGETDGGLQNLTLRNVAYRSDGIDVRLDTLRLRWNLGGLFASEVRVEEFRTEGLFLDVDTQALAASDREKGVADADAADAPLQLALPAPWRLILEEAVLKDAHLALDGHRLSWKRLATGFVWSGRALTVRASDGEELSLTVARSSGEKPGERSGAVVGTEEESEKGAEALGPDADPLRPPTSGVRNATSWKSRLDAFFAAPLVTELPTVRLPLDVTLEGLTLRGIRWTNAHDFGVPIPSLTELTFAARTQGDAVRLQTLRAEAPEGRAELSGGIRWGDAWPTDLTLAVRADRERLAAAVPDWGAYVPRSLSGRSDELSLRATLTGDVAGTLRAEVNLRGLSPEPVTLRSEAALNEANLPLRLAVRLPSVEVCLPKSSNEGAGDEAVEKADDNADNQADDPVARERTEGIGERVPRTDAEAGAVASAPTEGEAKRTRRTEATDRIAVRALTLDLSGDARSGYALSARGDVRAQGFGLAQAASLGLSVEGRADLSGADLRELTLRAMEGASGAVTLSGSARWEKDFLWRGEARTDTQGVDASGLWPTLALALRGGFATTLAMKTESEAGAWRASVDDLNLAGSVGQVPFEAKGGLWARENRVVGFDDLTLLLGRNRAALSGELQGARALDLTLTADVPGLDGTLPGLTGRARGFLRLFGTGARPGLEADLAAENLGFGSFRLKRAELKGNVKNRISDELMRRVLAGAREAKAEREREIAKALAAGRVPEGLSVRDAAVADALERSLLEGELAGTIDLALSGLKLSDDVNFERITLRTRGSEADHRVTLDVKGTPVSGRWLLKGAADRKTFDWKGTLLEGAVDTPAGSWTQKTPLTLRYADAAGELTGTAHVWTHPKAEVRVEPFRMGKKGEEGEAGVTLTRLDLSLLTPYLPKRRDRLEGVVTGRAKAAWSPGEAFPRAELHLETPSVRYVTRYDGQRLPISVTDAAIEGRLSETGAGVAWRLTPSDGARVEGRVDLSDLTDVRKLSGSVRARNVTPILLKPMLSRGEKAEGRLDADVRLEGTLRAPLAFGEVTLTGLEVDSAALPMSMLPSDVRLRLTGSGSELEGALRTADGHLLLSGEADWSVLSDWRARVGVRMDGDGRRLKVAVPPMVTASVVPELEASASPERVRVSGRITVPEASVEVRSLPPSAVKTSKDAVLLDENLRPVAPPQPPLPLEVDVSVGLTRILADGFGLKAGLTGELRAQQRPGRDLSLTGEVRIPGGRFRAYGQDLIVEKGEVRFAGVPDNPGLLIEAVRNPDSTADDVRVGVRVTGTAVSPKVELFSEPAMAQEEMLSYLLRGEGLSNLGEGDGAAMTNLLVALGTTAGNPFLSAVGETVGIKNLGLETQGVGDESQVVVSGYVLPNLQVKYGIGIFDSLATLTLRYRLMPQLYVEAVSGVDQALDFLYRFDF